MARTKTSPSWSSGTGASCKRKSVSFGRPTGLDANTNCRFTDGCCDGLADMCETNLSGGPLCFGFQPVYYALHIMAENTQSFKNHTKFDPAFHFFLAPLGLVLLIVTIVELVRDP